MLRHGSTFELSRFRSTIGVFLLATLGYVATSQAQTLHPGAASQCGRVAAVSRGPLNLEYFWSDPTGAVSHAAWNGSWSSEMLSLATFDPTNQEESTVYVSAVSRDPNSWDVFFVKNNYLVRSYWDSATGTHAAAQFGAQNVNPSYICAVSRDVGMLEVFYIGTDFSLQHTYTFDAKNWYGPYAMTPAGSVSKTSGLAAIAASTDSMDVFYADANQILQQLSWTSAAGWVSQPPVAGPIRGGADYFFPSALAAVSRDGVSKDVFYVDTNGHVVDASVSPAGKANQTFVADYVSKTDLAVVSRAPNAMEVFYAGANDMAVHHAYWFDGSGWTGPGLVLSRTNPPTFSNTYGSIAAVARSSTTMGVPYMDAYSYSLREFWYDSSNGWHPNMSIPASADSKWPANSAYKLQSISPDNNFAKDWTNDTQGIAHSKDMWYITHGDPGHTTDSLCKLPLSEPITNFSDWLSNYCYWFDGNTHLGDLDYHAGKVFLPFRIQSTGGAYIKVMMDKVPSRYDLVSYLTDVTVGPIAQANMSWLAINHRSGILYGSARDEVDQLSLFDIIYDEVGKVTNITFRGYLPLQIGGKPFTIVSSTGAAFSPNGHLYVVSNQSTDHSGEYGNSYGGIYGVDINTGAVRQIAVVGSSNFPQNYYGLNSTLTYDEAEGADYIDLDAAPKGTGLSGKLHVQMCNNFVHSDDGFSLYNYTISSPDM